MKLLIAPSVLVLVFCVAGLPLPAEESLKHVDLITVLKLAGANHEDIALAEARRREELAKSVQAWQRFWPSLSLGAGYRGHEGQVQDIAGAVFNASKQQYTVGTSVLVDWAPGTLWYGALAAKQRARAAQRLTEKAKRDVLTQAACLYYDLLAQEATVAIAQEDLRNLENYESQVNAAQQSGARLRADVLRVRSQLSRWRVELRQLQEQRSLAAAALAEALRLPSETGLAAAKADLLPLELIPLDTSVPSLVREAQQRRPEVEAAGALQEEARARLDEARKGPWMPGLQAGYGMGGLGGGIGRQWGNFSGSQDFFLGLGWRLGPGGLGDRQRILVEEARRDVADLQSQSLRSAIGREVVDAIFRARSARDQLQLQREAGTAAREWMGLAREGQNSGVSLVLEYLMAQDELSRARRGEVHSVAAFNKAQQQLKRALGR
jgi:outer membrane protein TolC